MAESNSTPKTVYPQDLTGIRFGKLVVESHAGRADQLGKTGRDSCWSCRCDCGNVIVVLRRSLVGGRSASCGCWHKQHPKDLVGVRFGMLTAECRVGTRNGDPTWRCLCDCGETVVTRRTSLIQGVVKSCGCLCRKYKPIACGDRYGMLVVTGRDPDRKRYWRCVCDCGKTKSVRDNCLKSGETRTCGCQTAVIGGRSRRRHGMAGTSVYNIWNGMACRGRGSESAAECYDNVRICQGWQKFENFYRDVGDRPSSKHSIDRIDNNGHYTCGRCDECIKRGDPMNCRWATAKQQAENRKTTRWITHDGQTKTMADWARVTGIGITTICYRLHHGWSEVDAITTPPKAVRAKALASKI